MRCLRVAAQKKLTFNRTITRSPASNRRRPSPPASSAGHIRFAFALLFGRDKFSIDQYNIHVINCKNPPEPLLDILTMPCVGCAKGKHRHASPEPSAVLFAFRQASQYVCVFARVQAVSARWASAIRRARVRRRLERRTAARAAPATPPIGRPPWRRRRLRRRRAAALRERSRGRSIWDVRKTDRPADRLTDSGANLRCACVWVPA